MTLSIVYLFLPASDDQVLVQERLFVLVRIQVLLVLDGGLRHSNVFGLDVFHRDRNLFQQPSSAHGCNPHRFRGWQFGRLRHLDDHVHDHLHDNLTVHAGIVLLGNNI